VNGVSIIGHGSSTAIGIKNMIRKAVETAQNGLHKQIERTIAAIRAEPSDSTTTTGEHETA
jgi:fatty acid/phospholipid biosynthesis enzyme